MKLILLIFSIFFLLSCSTIPSSKDNDKNFEKFFSVSGLTDMKNYDNLGSIETPIDIKVINIINENKNWQDNLQNVFPDGYWIYDGEKLINGNRVFTVPRNGLSLMLYIVPFFRQEFVKNHKRLYFKKGLTFNLTDHWLSRISKSDRCEVGKKLVSLPDSKISINTTSGTWYPTREEFIRKFCPNILDLTTFFINNLNCKRNKRTEKVFDCVWN